ncbi:MAG: EAL domain-containing protein [Gammaproteobacteria bacterium]
MKLTQLTAVCMVACIVGLLVLLTISLLSLASIRANQQSVSELVELKRRADNFSVASDSLLLFGADTSLWQHYEHEGRSLQSTLQALAETVPGTGKAAHHVKIILAELDKIIAADAAGINTADTAKIQNHSHGLLNLDHRSQIILNNIANHGIAMDTALSQAITQQQTLHTRDVYRTSLLFAGSAVLFAIISMIAFVWIYRRVNQPTRALLQTIKRAGAGDASARVDVSGRDELAAIGQAFNGLLDYQQNAHQHLQEQQAQLEHQRKMLEESQRIARLGSWRRDLQTNITEWSAECYRIVGRSPDSFTPSAQTLFDLVHPDDVESFTVLRDIALTGKQPLDTQIRIILPDGTTRYVHLWAELKYDNNGKPRYFSGSLQDVTEFHALIAKLEQNEQALRASRDELGDALAMRQTLINSLPAHIALLDADGRIIDVNDQWRHYGEENAFTDPHSGIGQSYIEICKAASGDCREDALAVAQGLKDTLAHKLTTFTLEYPCHSPDTKRWFRVMVNQLTSSQAGEENYGAVVMHIDITERKLAELELSQLAFEDQLTGLWSRNGFVAQLFKSIKRNGWPAHGIVVLLDIEQLHDVNDAHGYAVGDQLLIYVAELLRTSTGDNGLVGRTSGDQFMLYIQTESEPELEQQRVALESVFAEPLRLEDQLIYTNAHFGYTLLATDIRDVEALIHEAELALFETRRAKSGRWRIYKTEFDTASRDRVRLSKELRQALVNQNQEFELHFQPKVNLINGELIACEALLRWHHPERGLQPPASFIPVAEQSQLIRPIGRWVINEACRYLRRWRDEGLPIVCVSVNVSLVQFIDESFTEIVAAALADHQVEPGSLILEITESVLDEASGIIKAEILKLHETGVRLSLDDFGTGYSSLRYLQQYPFDEIKIDQSFVKNLVGNNYNRSIVSAILDIAEAIGAETVAEGIEDLAVRNALLDLGCKAGQGYYFSMPLEAEDFRWLLDKRCPLPLTASYNSSMTSA